MNRIFVVTIFFLGCCNVIIFDITQFKGLANGMLFILCTIFLIYRNRFIFRQWIILLLAFIYAISAMLVSEDISVLFKIIIPLICLWAGYYMALTKEFHKIICWLYLYIVLSPIFDRYILGKNDFGEQTGYFLFSSEGNVYSFILFVITAIYMFVRQEKLERWKLYFIYALTLFSANLMGSKFLILSFLLIFFYYNYKFYRASVYIFIASLLPLIISFHSELLGIVNGLAQIIDRVQIQDQSILQALLSSRNVTFLNANVLFFDSQTNLILFGDLLNGNDAIPYVEMDIFHLIFDYGFVGAILMISFCFLFIIREKGLCHTITSSSSSKNKNVLGFAFILLCIGGFLVGHLFFRAPGAFFFGVMLSSWLNYFSIIRNFKNQRI